MGEDGFHSIKAEGKEHPRVRTIAEIVLTILKVGLKVEIPSKLSI